MTRCICNILFQQKIRKCSRNDEDARNTWKGWPAGQVRGTLNTEIRQKTIIIMVVIGEE